MTQVVKVPPSNGATKPPAALVVVTNQPEKKAEKQQTKEADLPALDERLHRLNQLFEIQAKYNRLLAAKQKLNEFKLNQKSENITLSIEDYNNRSFDFETKNPEVIAEVLECLRQTIDAKIKALEPQLKW